MLRCGGQYQGAQCDDDHVLAAALWSWKERKHLAG